MIKIDKKIINAGKKITIILWLILCPNFLFSIDKITFGITGSIYKSDIKVFDELKQYIDAKAKNVNVEIVFSRTYADMGALVASGKVDIAYMGSPHFVTLRDENFARLLVVPVIQDGAQKHYAFIIAHKDKNYESLFDFEGKVFAFGDPDSKAGAIAPSYFLASRGFNPKTFFKKVVYTREHEESIRAVLRGFVDGASVNSFVFEHFIETFPQEASRLSVVQKIGPFTISPIISKQSLSKEHYALFQEVLTQMHLDPKGRSILHKLHLLRFDMPKNESYDDVKMMKSFLKKFDQ